MKWWYRYIRADWNEIDMGPYDSREKAQEASDQHKSFGAMASNAFEKPDDYIPFGADDDE